MRSLMCFLLLAAVCVAGEAGGASAEPSFEWLQLHGSAGHGNYRERKDSVVLPKVLWHARDAIGQPSIRAGWLYCGGPVLGRISAATGTFERSPAADTRAVGPTPALTDDVVIVRRPAGMVEGYSHDLRRRIWLTKTNARDAQSCDPPAWQGNLCVINEGGGVLALGLRTGRIAWRFPIQRGVVALTPALGNGRVYFGGDAGGVWALDLKSGTALWATKGAEHFGLTCPVLADGNLLLADRGSLAAGSANTTGRLHAFDPNSGTRRWIKPFERFSISTPGVGPERIVVGTVAAVMQFDPRTGRELQPRVALEATALGTPAIVGSTLYFGTDAGYLQAHDLRTGALNWRMHFPGAAPKRSAHEVRSIVHTGTQIYVETTNGLYCLGQDPQRRGVRPQNETLEAPE